MKNRNIIVWVVAGLLAMVNATYAQKKLGIGDFPFWAGKDDSKVGQYVPGLNEALKLTGEQIEQIHAAARETTGNDALQAAGRKIKGDPNATAAEREAALKLFKEAQATLQERVAKIITAEQRTLIRQIELIHTEVQTALLAEFQPRFATAKASKEEMQKLNVEIRAKLEIDFLQRLDPVLSAPQRAAIAKAIADSKVAALVKKPKP